MMGEIAPLGLRERNKNEKLRRIRDASRELFFSQGYRETSTREIAYRAHVGLATLFLYADNKRDLLFLAFSEDLSDLAVKPFSKIDESMPLLDQLILVFCHFFEFYSHNRDLSRDLLREIVIYTSGRQAEVFHRTREATISRIEQLIAACRRRGSIAPMADDSALAHLVFDIFASSLRRWLGLADAPVEQGLNVLRDQFKILIDGFRPSGRNA